MSGAPPPLHRMFNRCSGTSYGRRVLFTCPWPVSKGHTWFSWRPRVALDHWHDSPRLLFNNGILCGRLSGSARPVSATEQNGASGRVGLMSGFRLVTVLLLAAVSAPAAGAAVAAPDPRAGAAISAQCAVCHGSNGISVAANIPNLAGQRFPYLVARMMAFKNGTVQSATMNEMARSLSEEQIEDLSAYFASIPVKVEAPGHAR